MSVVHAPAQHIVNADSALDQHSTEKPLQFTQNGTFQISIFEDLHFAENATRDTMTKEVMRSILSNESTQLVVLNGDLISGEFSTSSNASSYLHQIVSPLVEKNQTWASTYGNHDSDANLDPRKDIYNQERQYPHSLTKSMHSAPNTGITNYYLPVYSRSSPLTPALILWFFDSKGGRYPTNRSPDLAGEVRGDWVDESVVEWFTQTNARLTAKYQQTIPSLAFFHIPTHAMRGYQKQGVDSHKTPGINGERVVSQGSGETKYSGQDRGFMQALLNTDGLIATFSGHDHENDWCFKWDGRLLDQDLTGNGIIMCYGRHTGYGGYGDAKRGARQVFLQEGTLGDEVHTWVRLEDGSVSASVTLNKTYGHDRYATVGRRMVERSGSVRGYDSSGLVMVLCLWVGLYALWMGRFR